MGRRITEVKETAEEDRL